MAPTKEKNAPGQEDAPDPQDKPQDPASEEPVQSEDHEPDVEQDSADEFRENQLQLAKEQGQTGDNAVPEQRPQAFGRVDDSHQSETYRRLKEAGELQSQEEPMGQEAYEKADSDAQKDEADEASLSQHLLEGTRVVIDDSDSPHNGRNAYVLRINWKDQEALRTRAAGTPESRFAEAESYTVKTRDGRPELLEFTEDQLRIADRADWGRGQI